MKKIQAKHLKKNEIFIYNNKIYQTISVINSKSGKHGHSKTRVDCWELFNI